MIVGIIGFAILVFGPNKIPELARGLGRAKREFDKARQGLDESVDTLVKKEKAGD